MNFLVNKKIEEIAEEIASSINKKLKEGKKVLWVISGGSAIPVEVLVSKKIRLLGRNRLLSWGMRDMVSLGIQSQIGFF